MTKILRNLKHIVLAGAFAVGAGFSEPAPATEYNPTVTENLMQLSKSGPLTESWFKKGCYFDEFGRSTFKGEVIDYIALVDLNEDGRPDLVAALRTGSTSYLIICENRIPKKR